MRPLSSQLGQSRGPWCLNFLAPALSLALFVAPPSWADEAETIPHKVERLAAMVRDLNALYEDPTVERAIRMEALSEILQHTAWLEEVGGLRSARVDCLLALARMAVNKIGDPVRYAYRAESSGTLVAQLTLRAPKKDELPPPLQPLVPTLYLVAMRNHTARPFAVRSAFSETRDLVGVVHKSSLVSEKDLPEEVVPWESLFIWPDQISGLESVQRLVLVPKEKVGFRSLVFELGQVDGKEGSVRFIRALFPERDEPDAYREALRVAAREIALFKARLEAQSKDGHEDKSGTVSGNGREDHVPVAESDQKVLGANRNKDLIPPSLGWADLTGSEQRIQIRIRLGVKIKGGEILRVRKKGAWCGRVQLDNQLVGSADSGSGFTLYWAKIFEGTRTRMAGGTLHQDLSLER